jgi:hypothetical protein
MTLKKRKDIIFLLPAFQMKNIGIPAHALIVYQLLKILKIFQKYITH